MIFIYSQSLRALVWCMYHDVAHCPPEASLLRGNVCPIQQELTWACVQLSLPCVPPRGDAAVLTVQLALPSTGA